MLALGLLIISAWFSDAFAAVGEPRTITCDPAQCETCLEYSGPDNRCLKCSYIEGCLIDKGGGPRSESPGAWRCRRLGAQS